MGSTGFPYRKLGQTKLTENVKPVAIPFALLNLNLLLKDTLCDYNALTQTGLEWKKIVTYNLSFPVDG